MTLGDFSQVVNAQNVTLTVGSGVDEVITLYDLSLIDESVIDRRNPRDGPIDTPAFSLIEIIASAVISEDLYLFFRTMRQLSTRGALPIEPFTIVATNIGLSGADFTESGNFILRRMESKAPERGRYEVTLTIRIDGSLAVS